MHSCPQAFHVALSASFLPAMPYSSMLLTIRPVSAWGLCPCNLVEGQVSRFGTKTPAVAIKRIQVVVVGPKWIPRITIRLVPFMDVIKVHKHVRYWGCRPCCIKHLPP